MTRYENPYRFFSILQELNGSHEAEINHTLLRQKLDEIIRHNVQSLHFLQVNIHQNLLPIEVIFVGFRAAENAPYHDRCATRIGAEKRKKSGKKRHIQPHSAKFTFPPPPHPVSCCAFVPCFTAWKKMKKYTYSVSLTEADGLPCLMKSARVLARPMKDGEDPQHSAMAQTMDDFPLPFLPRIKLIFGPGRWITCSYVLENNRKFKKRKDIKVVLYQSINQSKVRMLFALFEISRNQSIHQSGVLQSKLLLQSINQTIDRSFPWRCEWTETCSNKARLNDELMYPSSNQKWFHKHANLHKIMQLNLCDGAARILFLHGKTAEDLDLLWQQPRKTTKKCFDKNNLTPDFHFLVGWSAVGIPRKIRKSFIQSGLSPDFRKFAAIWTENPSPTHGWPVLSRKKN